MDKITLKSIIIEMRNNGDSFQKISDELKKKYNINKSRQAVCGLYNRATSEEQQGKNIDNVILRTDIVNYTSIGLTETQIKELLTDVSNYKISEVINNSKDYLAELENEHVNTVKNILINSEDIGIIKSKLQYKNSMPTDEKIKQLIELATQNIIRDNTTTILVHILKITDDRELINNIIKKFNLDIKSKDINNSLNRL